jgi:hypothetical protein
VKILLSVAFLLTCPAAFATDCSGIWRNGFPDVRPVHTPVDCDEFIPLSTPRVPSQRLYTAASITSVPAVKQQMEWISEALSYSADKYATYGRVPPMTVVRQDVPHPNGGGAAAMAFTYVQFFDADLESCPIFVYPLSEVLNKEHLQQLVAHEVFHCVQKVNFKDQITHAATSGDQDWWFEGLAQLFSNFVYPANDFEYTSRFPAPDQTLPFWDQPNAYSSENFWQSYANLIGDGAVFATMGAMPTGPGSTGPAALANALPRISEGMHEYAKQISLKRVRDSAGPMSPYDMALESHVLADVAHQTVDLMHPDFVVGAFRVRLPKAGRWTLRFDSPANTKISLKKAEDHDYAPVSGPLDITSECDQEREVQVVITTVTDQQAMNTTRLVVDKSPNPECDCVAHPDAPPQVDQCLVGTWDLDHTTVAAFWHRLNHNPRLEFAGSTGGFAVQFGLDSTGTWIAADWRIAARSQIRPGMTLHQTRITDGASTFRVSANGNIACTQQTGSSMTAVDVININGRESSRTTGLPFDPSAGVFTYSCSPTEFVFRQYTIGGQAYDIEYVFRRR